MAELHVNQFDGGILNKICATLLQPNAAVDVIDAQITGGCIEPFNGPLFTGVIPEDLAYQNEQGSRSIVKFGGVTFWTENESGDISSSLGYVGVTPPSGLPIATPRRQGNRFIGRYQYLITFISRDGVESAPYAIDLDASDQAVSVNAQIQSETVLDAEGVDAFNPKHPRAYKRYGYDEGDIVTYVGRTWRCKQAFHGERIQGDTSWNSRDRRRPIAEWQYPNSDDGLYWEDVTQTQINVLGYEEIRLESIPQSAESYVSTIRIYRTVADGNTFYQVAEVDIGTTSHIDTVSDSVAVLNPILAQNLTWPPVYEAIDDNKLSKLPVKYLTYQNGLFYLAARDRLYISEVDAPHQWDLRKYLEFEDTITGIARARSTGVLVFTNNRTYHVTGSTFVDIERDWIPQYQGCPNWRTITYIQDTPMWLSFDGLCKYGYEPDIQQEVLRNVTLDSYEWPDTVDHAVSMDEAYHAFTTDGYCVIYNAARGNKIYRRSLDSQSSAYDKDRDKLILFKNGSYFDADGGDPQEWVYTSPEFNMGTASPKRVRSMWFNCTEDVDVEVFVDGVSRYNGTSQGTRDRRHYLAHGLVGDLFQFKISSKGKLTRYSVEWHEVQYGR